ncbi:putative RNA-directed DNA polymerase from transposon X-element [Trichonephila clavipes]|nr:putative RNA-directed DNA polymerase from transposon X-element [Trichonephila clavipes]
MAYSDFEKADAFKDTLEVTFQENEEPYCDDKIEVENLVNHFFDNFATSTPPLTSPSEPSPSLGEGLPLSLENKVILYKQILRPVITYGSPVWGAAAATHMKKIQVIQNKILRVMMNAPWTATAGLDVVQYGRPIFDDFFQHLWPYIGNSTANVVFQMVECLWLIRIDQ